MRLTATCTFDMKSITALTYVSMYKRFRPRIAFHFTNGIAALSAAVNFNYPLLMVLSAILLIGNCLMYFFLPKMQYAALNRMQNVVNTYTFCDDIIKIESKGELYEGGAELRYSMLQRVMETSEYFFLFQSKNQVFIVDKATITGGTAMDLQNKLAPYVKKKYFLCAY